MAVRKVIVRSLPKPGEDRREVIGQLVDDGQSAPYGTTPAVDSMLTADRRERFDRYRLGYSNGFTFETLPQEALSNPDGWQQFLDWARGPGRDASQAAKLARLDSIAA